MNRGRNIILLNAFSGIRITVGDVKLKQVVARQKEEDCNPKLERILLEYSTLILS